MDMELFWILYFAAGFILFFEGLLGSPDNVRRISKKNPELSIKTVYKTFIFVLIGCAIVWPVIMIFVLYDYLFNNSQGGS